MTQSQKAQELVTAIRNEEQVAFNPSMIQGNQFPIVIEETPEYKLYQMPDGRKERVQLYQEYNSHVPETLQEKQELYIALHEEDSELVTRFSKATGKVITIAQCFHMPFQTINKETGEIENGVRTLIKDGETNQYFTTVSKSIYFTTRNMFGAFGYPDTQGYEPIKVKIGEKQFDNGASNTLSLVKE